MKVVLDTNVLISGIFWNGIPRKILKLWRNNEINILISKPILKEYLRILKRIATQEKIYEYWAVFIFENTELIKIRKFYHICRDRHDDKFIDCALAGKAEYLISGDQDLLSTELRNPVKIIRPKDFLEIFFEKSF